MSLPVEQLLLQHEGKTLEFKRDLSSPRNVLKTLVAFANSAGGRLVIGVDDERGLVGLPEPAISEIATGVRLSIYLQEPVRLEAGAGAQPDNILQLLVAGALSANALVAGLGLKSKTGAFKRTIKELLDSGLLAYTLPDKPDSRLQQYRLTEPGQKTLARHRPATTRNHHDG